MNKKTKQNKLLEGFNYQLTLNYASKHLGIANTNIYMHSQHKYIIKSTIRVN